EFELVVGSVAESLQGRGKLIDFFYPVSFERRPARAALSFWGRFLFASLTVKRSSARNTAGKLNRTMRGLIRSDGITFLRCRLSTLRELMLNARASSPRFSSAGSFAADPVADTGPPCAFERPLM